QCFEGRPQYFHYITLHLRPLASIENELYSGFAPIKSFSPSGFMPANLGTRGEIENLKSRRINFYLCS
ncbi:hypothetical protein L9F63_013727, partial [Diploptera punctata]